MRIQFILKKNENYGFTTYTRRSSGLFNSTRFIAESLAARGVVADIVEVLDNNFIDREVTRFKPDLVVIEALWVVPEKFAVLKKLHPKVQWFVHLHSNMPFLALEGIAMDWISRYAEERVGVIANSTESFDALRAILHPSELHYLPNVYLTKPRRAVLNEKDAIDIGCFGAVRPLKNQLLQALAAIQFAREIHKPLRFHVNASRIETGGQPVMKNLVQLFEHTPDAELVQTHWCEPEEFLDLLQNTIDIGMQVSLTETFNVVNADYVTAGVPSVVSKEIKWASSFNVANEHDIRDIVKILHRVRGNRILVWWNQLLLEANSKHAQQRWFEFSQGDLF